MKFLIALSICLLLASGTVYSQTINANGNFVGSGNGSGGGNGNGDGNGNHSNNTTGGNSATDHSNLTTGGNSAVTFNGKRNTPSVLAPGLAAAGIETCLGSTSVGGAGPGFGVTIAGTIHDRGCDLRLFSRTLYSMGHKVAAVQILCNDPDVAAALALEGVRCLVGPAAEAEARAAASARAEIAQPAAPADVGKRPTCQNWVLFQGCLDKPEAAKTADNAMEH